MTPKIQTYDFANQLVASKEFFERSTRVLDEADSGFRPQEGAMTAAQQVAHAAQTLDWFVEGVSRSEGFDLDFENLGKALAGVTSLAAARQMLDKAYANAIQFIRSRTPEDLARPLPAGPVMGGQPMSDIVWAMIEHTAHHRGALTVYSRLLGKVPPMPYGGLTARKKKAPDRSPALSLNTRLLLLDHIVPEDESDFSRCSWLVCLPAAAAEDTSRRVVGRMHPGKVSANEEASALKSRRQGDGCGLAARTVHQIDEIGIILAARARDIFPAHRQREPMPEGVIHQDRAARGVRSLGDADARVGGNVGVLEVRLNDPGAFVIGVDDIVKARVVD